MCETGCSAHRLCATDRASGALFTCSVAGKVNRGWLPGKALVRCTVRLSTCVAAPHSPEPPAATFPLLADELGEAVWPADPAGPPLPQATTAATVAAARAAAGTLAAARRTIRRLSPGDVRLRGTSIVSSPFPGHGHLPRFPLTGRAGNWTPLSCPRF